MKYLCLALIQHCTMCKQQLNSTIYTFQKFKQQNENIYTLILQNLISHKAGILGRLWYVVAVYLLLYYIINIVFIQVLQTCDKEDVPSQNGTIGMILHSQSMQSIIKEMHTAEKGFTTLLTFFLGFYVSFIIVRWWQQVSQVPTIDEIGQTLHGLVGVDSDDRSNEEIVKLQQKFKETIVRYCLLSWTMCLSGFSLPLKMKFLTEREYLNSGLLKYEEYLRLNAAATDGTIDGWTDKWAIPLNWAAFKLNEASNIDINNGNDKSLLIVPAEHKDVVQKIHNFQAKLVMLTKFFEFRMPQIQTQVITIAVWLFLVIGVVAGQGTFNKCDQYNMVIALMINFPFFQLFKYILIFGWLKTANYCQLPFGSDKG